MRYLTDHRADVRSDAAQLLPGVRSIICVGLVYNGPEPLSTDFSDLERAWISRYAWGEDYHDVLRSRIEALAGNCWRSSHSNTGSASIPRRCLSGRWPIRPGLGGLARILPDQSADRVMVFPGGITHYARSCAGFASARPLRHLFALHRCVSDRRDCSFARWAIRTRCAALYFLFHDRAAVFDSGGVAARDRRARVWLRYLPGCLSVEPAGGCYGRNRRFVRELLLLLWNVWPRWVKRNFGICFAILQCLARSIAGFCGMWLWLWGMRGWRNSAVRWRSSRRQQMHS